MFVATSAPLPVASFTRLTVPCVNCEFDNYDN